ncbi:oligosaccharide biosynthesis protein Alg14 like-domain-containing protein [Biscogniauxia marginata]|nr:oligosaccharide biosynthesis protein Alg14 like-domain-containing protein [Biscogniauxia marginata]
MAPSKNYADGSSGFSQPSCPSPNPPLSSDIPLQTPNNNTSNTKEEQHTCKEINQLHQSCIEAMDTNRDRAIPGLLNATLSVLLPLLVIIGTVVFCGLAVFTLAAANGISPGRVVAMAFVVLASYLLLGGNNAMVRSKVVPHYVLIVCGSGGHTAEMIQMIERSIRPEKSAHRRWVIGRDDENSYHRVMAFERRLLRRFSKQNFESGSFDILCFKRARAVHQSWLTTPFSALMSIHSIFSILITPPFPRFDPAFRFPGVIVTNGPGTGFLFLLAARVLKILPVVPRSHMKAIYVESWARVKSLSLTGKLINRCMLADLFIVQSRFLAERWGIFAGNLPAMPVNLDIPLEPED